MTDKIVEMHVRCLTCGTWFPSPIFFAGMTTFQLSEVYGNIAQCPNGHFTPCNKENMRVRLEGGAGGWVGADTI